MVVSEIALAVLIFIGIMAITALVFGGWIVVNVLKGIGNVLFGSPQKPQRRSNIIPPPAVGNFGVPARPLSSAGVPPPLPIRGTPFVTPGASVPCQGPGCRQANPTTARFCRRCGHPISQVTAAAQRRVAMW